MKSNGGRNILINSQLKRILFMGSNEKKWNKTERDRNDMEKENNSNESDFKENEIPDLNSLKQKQAEILTVVAVIIRKKVLNIKQVSGASAVQKQSLADVLQNRCQACNFIKKRLQYRCFAMKSTKFLRTPWFTEHLYCDGCFWQ